MIIIIRLTTYIGGREHRRLTSSYTSLVIMVNRSGKHYIRACLSPPILYTDIAKWGTHRLSNDIEVYWTQKFIVILKI